MATQNFLKTCREQGLDSSSIASAMFRLARALEGKRDFFFLRLSGIDPAGKERLTEIWVKVDNYNGQEGIDRLVTLLLPEDY